MCDSADCPPDQGRDGVNVIGVDEDVRDAN
jgi:hypothetical protein